MCNGEVPGTLLNQKSETDRKGLLRNLSYDKHVLAYHVVSHHYRFFMKLYISN